MLKPQCIMNKHLQNQQGAISVLFVILLPIFIIITALVIDFGNTIRIQTQLKNIADAAAIRGADSIYRSCSFTPSQFPEGLYIDNTYFDADGVEDDDCINNGSVTKTYAEVASEAAMDAINLNDNKGMVKFSQVDVNFTDSEVINTAPQYHYPAVKVSLTGSSYLFFGGFILDDFDITVESVAVVGYPKKLEGGIPVAISDCALASVWDFATSQPTTSNTFTVSTQSSDPLLCGPNTANAAWTNFDGLSSSMNAVKCFVPGACTAPNETQMLDIGDTIYVNNGEGSIYKDVDFCILEGICSDDDNKVILPIIGTDGFTLNQDGTLSQYGTGVVNSGFHQIIGFGCAKLIRYDNPQGNIEQFIEADFSSGCGSGKGTLGGSAYYGVLLPPKLAK
jgi:hypothetical protein